MELIIGALVFAFVVSLAQALRYRSGERRPVVERIVGESRDEREGALALELEPDEPARLGYLGRLEREARQAGLRVAVRDLLFVMFAVAAVGFLGAFMLTRSFLLGLAALAMGYYAPRWYLGRLKRQRVRAFEAQFEHALTQMANSLRAGEGLMNAVRNVGETMPDPIGYEFRRVYQQMRLGTPQIQALRQVRERVDSEDYEVFVAAVDLQLETGGNLIESFERIAATIRDRQRAREQVRAKTAQQQLSSLIISAMPVLLILGLSIFRPGYMSIFTTTLIGRMALMVCLGLIAVGWIWVRRIVDIRFE